ncbi:4Fe-4S binding protein [uncultured Thiodictyon sp.]|uniref:4Fe-4S binding protein n=1 Tax=uncultured Thiodictyon sp. TaxID=1846217 RepID=UPI0025DFC13B|nr:4Fe-4S binding protein [uncultured Thiodictyon sp.]
MPRPLSPLLAILVLGAFAQIAQAVLIREALVVFYGNEVSLGAFYGSWLLWLGAGAAAALSWERRWGEPWTSPPAAVAALRLILCGLPLVLCVQVLGLRSVRWLLDVSASEWVPLGDLFLTLTLVNLPGGVLFGLAFALTCRALAIECAGPGGAVAPVARAYVADALGALLGGVVFTFVLIRWLGPVAALGLVTAVLALTAGSLPRPGAPGICAAPEPRLPWVPWILAITGLLAVLPPIARPLELRLEQWRFASLQPGMELLDSVDTPYGHVAVARRGQQTSVVADGQVQQSFPLPLEVERQAAYFLAQAPLRPPTSGRVLVLGGYAGGLAAALLRYPLERVDQVEQDSVAFARVRPFLAAADRAALTDPHLTLHFGDSRGFLRRLALSYDLILSLDATPATAAGNRLFTREAFVLARAHLAPGGVFCTQVSAASNYVGRAVGGYAGSLDRTLRSVFATVVLVPGNPLVLCAGDPPARLTEDPAELKRRYLAAGLPEHRLPPGTFATLLPAQEVAFLHARLGDIRTKAGINTDAQPLTYYLNMVLWGQFSGSGLVDALERLQRLGPWPYLVPPLLFVVLWLVRAGLEGGGRPAPRRGAGVFALAVLGFIVMAGQLALLFSYQAQVGLVFERIALFNGLFMAGLALGGGAVRPLAAGPRAGLALLGQMAAVAAGLLLLPLILDGLASLVDGAREAGYLALTLVLGWLAGAGFTLCVGFGQDQDGSALRSGALAMAADSLGGALGGLVTGALMVPLLGVDATCRVLALAAVLALIPLGVACLMSPSAAGPRGRGVPSFPWPGLGWGLVYGLLLVYAWSVSPWQTAPAPQVRFDPERLAQVSGSVGFTLAQLPFVHYLGRHGGESEPQTVTLASAATGPGATGFAGPIELLLAIGRDGALRGVQYLGSRETPSYIAGIETWLLGLRGTDLSRAPLSLERVDGLSGATLTSRAVLATINSAARRGTAAAFGQAVPPAAAGAQGGPDWGLYATGLLLILCFPVYLFGGERARLLFQALTLLVLGVWLNAPVTELDLVQLSQGQVATLLGNPQRLLLLGFIAVSSLLFGQVWCGYLCPFGALQEFASHLGRRLGLRSYPERSLEQAARSLKFLLLAVLLVLVWTTGESAWATFNPMQHCFGSRFGGWMLGLTSAVLAASLVYYRFWCRYLCPLGAFLALGNKLALLQRLAPPRRFSHCDLGVKGEYDLDCIRCQRCRSGLDTQVGRRPSR